MRSALTQHLATVTAGHALLLGALIVAAAFPGWRHKTETVAFPIQMMLDSPTTEETKPFVSLPAPAPEPPAIAAPEPPAVTPPAPSPFVRAPAVRPPTPRVRHPPLPPRPRAQARQTPRLPKVSAQQIERILSGAVGSSSRHPMRISGAPAGTAGADDSGWALIRQAFYEAWQQPSFADAGNAEATVTIRLGGRGTVLEARLTRSSGNALLDTTVNRALPCVTAIPGLSADFVRDHPVVTLAFKVEKENLR